MIITSIRARLLALLALTALVALAWTSPACADDDKEKTKVDPKEIAKLIDLLGDDDEDKRAAAEQKLIEWGEQSHEHVKKAIKDHPDADVRLRATLLEKKIARGAFRELRKMIGHTKTIRAIAVSKDGKRAVTCGQDKTIRLWDLTTGKEIKKLEGHKGFAWHVGFTADEKQVISSGGPDKTVRLWDLDKAEELQQYTGFRLRVLAAVISPDEKYVVGGEGGDKDVDKDDDPFDVHLFDKKTGKLVHRMKGHTGYVWRAAFSPDSTKVATAGMNDNSYRIWDVETGKATVIGKDAHDDCVTGVVFGNDGKELYTCGRDSKVKVWDATSGKLLKALEGMTNGCEAIALSKDGKRLLAADDKTVVVFDVGTGRIFHRFEEHSGQVCAVAFMPDGLKALSAGADNTLRLWSIPK